jgi:hypothetical protein
MKKILVPISIIICIVACHSGQPETTTAVSSEKADSVKKNYLPVADYLKSEIAAVDSFPLRIMKYHIENAGGVTKTDSGIITTAIFDQVARQFLMPDLDSSLFEKRFEENSFVDRSTNLVSFTYSTKGGGYGLKRVDVLLSPGAGFDKLSSIYMEAISGNLDTVTISKMTWKAGRNFRVLHIRKPKNGPETTNQTIVVWDSRD